MRRRSDPSLRFLTRLPLNRLALLLSLAFLVCTLTIFLSVRNWTYTAFRRTAAATRAMHHHDRALVTSTHYLNSLTEEQLQQWQPAQNPSLTLVILTCHRSVPYINVLVASLLQGQAPEELSSSVQVHVLDVERDPALQDSHEARILQKIPLLQYRNASNGVTEDDTWLVRGTKDYVKALRACQEGPHVTPWCVILEEDALLTDDFLRKFREGVVDQLQDDRHKVAFVKLWTTDWWDGFENEDLPKMTLWIVAAASMLTVLVDCLCCKGGQRANRIIPLLMFFVFSVLTIAVNLYIVNAQALSQVGQPSYLHLRELGQHHASGNVAIAYPNRVVPAVVEFVESAASFKGDGDPIDVVIGVHFCSHNPQFHALEVAPSLVQHMGVYSSGGLGKNSGDFFYLKQDSKFLT